MSGKTPAKDLVLWSSIVTRTGDGAMRANSYYRVLVPFLQAKDMGLAQDFFIEGHTPLGPTANNEERALMALLSDVIVLSNTFSDSLTKNIAEVKKLIPAIDPDSLQRVYPPVTVFDQDDLTEYVSIFNDTFCALGVRGPNGDELKPGDRIALKSSVEGEEDLVLWEDGVCPHCQAGECMPGMHRMFDIAANRERIDKIYQLARTCHGATFTTERLRAFYRDVVGLKNTHVFPNSIYAKHYRKVELADHPNEVRILWQGGSSHFQDWQPYAAALSRVMHKNPHAKLILWGQPYEFMMKMMPLDRCEHLPWVPHAAYISQLNTMNHDINLAPLANNMFNSCKSAIKWYEASACTKPVVTLASATPPYSDELVDGDTGLLFASEEEFETKLQGLIDDAVLRGRLASNAKDWVLENREASKTVPDLIEWYMTLRAEYDEMLDGAATMDVEA